MFRQLGCHLFPLPVALWLLPDLLSCCDCDGDSVTRFGSRYRETGNRFGGGTAFIAYEHTLSWQRFPVA